MSEEHLDAWLPETLAAAIGVDTEIAERVLDEAVTDGEWTRVTCGSTTFYVGGAISATLTRLDAMPVEGDRLDERRARARRIRVGQKVADLDKPKTKGGKSKGKNR